MSQYFFGTLIREAQLFSSFDFSFPPMVRILCRAGTGACRSFLEK